jgi:hypothetical protein
VRRRCVARVRLVVDRWYRRHEPGRRRPRLDEQRRVQYGWRWRLDQLVVERRFGVEYQRVLVERKLVVEYQLVVGHEHLVDQLVVEQQQLVVVERQQLVLERQQLVIERQLVVWGLLDRAVLGHLLGVARHWRASLLEPWHGLSELPHRVRDPRVRIGVRLAARVPRRGVTRLRELPGGVLRHGADGLRH